MKAFFLKLESLIQKRVRLAGMTILLLGSAMLWVQPAYAELVYPDEKPDDGVVEPDEDVLEKEIPRAEVYGFAQFFALTSFVPKDTPERFRVQRVRVKLRGKVNDHIGFQVEVDPRAPDVTGIMRDAYITMDYIPRHEIRLGQQKTQFGYENNVSSSSLYFVNRTDVSDDLSRGLNLRDVGVGLIGNIRINKDWRFEDAITVVNGRGLNVQTDQNRKKNIWGRLGLRYKDAGWMVRFGASGGYGDMFEKAVKPDTVDELVDFKRFGADVQIEQKWFTMAGEYVKGTDEEFGISESTEGFYVLATGKVGRRFGPTLRYENVDKGDFTRWVAGAYYGMPDERFRFLLNYEFTSEKRLYFWFLVRF